VKGFSGVYSTNPLIILTTNTGVAALLSGFAQWLRTQDLGMRYGSAVEPMLSIHERLGLSLAPKIPTSQPTQKLEVMLSFSSNPGYSNQ
jgi:hypothetical protein